MPREATTKEAIAKAKRDVPEKKPPMTMFEAYIEFQKQVPAIRKDARGNYGEYSSLDELIGKARPVLNRLGFALMQDVYTDESGANWIQTILPHISGQKMESRPLKLRDEGVGMQKLGSAITYGRRYQAGTFLGLITDEDNDAQVAQDATEESERQGMLAQEKQRPQYVAFIQAWSKKLGLPVREDLETVTTTELVAEAQKVKQKKDESEAQSNDA